VAEHTVAATGAGTQAASVRTGVAEERTAVVVAVEERTGEQEAAGARIAAVERTAEAAAHTVAAGRIAEGVAEGAARIGEPVAEAVGERIAAAADTAVVERTAAAAVPGCKPAVGVPAVEARCKSSANPAFAAMADTEPDRAQQESAGARERQHAPQAQPAPAPTRRAPCNPDTL